MKNSKQSALFVSQFAMFEKSPERIALEQLRVKTFEAAIAPEPISAIAPKGLVLMVEFPADLLDTSR